MQYWRDTRKITVEAIWTKLVPHPDEPEVRLLCGLWLNKVNGRAIWVWQGLEGGGESKSRRVAEAKVAHLR